ncbi:hypothetical protein [Lysobacter auxotrophicus]|uniref:Uncharacterized protein n=1 Tax=Lysobacter auxotrophicus TaxID=2992573 RepID=A0ABM8D9I5_9GAMM|nr:hypothetical protein [Lysobacter auxotrophicus]BDU15181.1 hypothetical protein LA521A_03820 [Lysobacter auxotrophicus]
MQDASGAVDLDAINACLAHLPTGALLAQLDAILAAIDSSDPSRQRRRSGFLGLLLARDLVAQAQAGDADTRVRLHLAAAHDIAAQLADQAAQLESVPSRLRDEAVQLRSSTTDPATDDPQRRAAIAATWETAAAHVELVRGHAAQLLRRHAQVRDVLVPAWRQQAAISARGGTARIVRLDDALRSQIAALRAAAVTPVPSTDPSQDPAPAIRDADTQEPSP